jgi:hypothetical protein
VLGGDNIAIFSMVKQAHILFSNNVEVDQGRDRIVSRGKRARVFQKSE